MFLKTSLLFCTIVCSGLKIIQAIKSNRPNIVIIMADDMGFDDVSFRGSKQFSTPNIDALAYHGKIINNFYTPSMCTPSRAALLSGLWPIHTGTQHLVLLNEEPWGILQNLTNMAEIFQAHGYATNLIGKWHLGMARRAYTPNSKGFDYFYGYLGGFIGYYDRRSKMPTNSSLGYDFRRNFDVECAAKGSYVTDLFTEEATRVIANHNTTQPLFLMVNHLAPHTGSNEAPLAAPRDEINKFNYIKDEEKRIFAAMVSKLDDSLGQIVKALDNKHILNNSIIVFYSDNGAPTKGLFSNGGSNWPFRGQKDTPWEGALRVPGIIWSPLLENKSSIYEPIMHISDLLPTLTAAAKIPLNSYKLKLDGINHWPDLKAASVNRSSIVLREREILHVMDELEQVSSFRQGRFKYIKGTTHKGKYDGLLSFRNDVETDPREHYYEQIIQSSLVAKALTKYDEQHLSARKIRNLRLQLEIKCGQHLETACHPLDEECLYDLQQDPCERNNVAENPQYKNILAKMSQRLEELRETAVEPCTGGSKIDYDPTRHDCSWTYYLDEPKTDYISECDYESPPCPS